MSEHDHEDKGSDFLKAMDALGVKKQVKKLHQNVWSQRPKPLPPRTNTEDAELIFMEEMRRMEEGLENHKAASGKKQTFEGPAQKSPKVESQASVIPNKASELKESSQSFLDEMAELGVKSYGRERKVPEKVENADEVAFQGNFDALSAEFLESEASAQAVESRKTLPRKGIPLSSHDRKQLEDHSIHTFQRLLEEGALPPLRTEESHGLQADEAEGRKSRSKAALILKKLIKSDAMLMIHDLDLHGLTRQEAYRETKAFLLEHQRDQVRLVRIITGKGFHSENREAILRPEAKRWFENDFSDLIRAFTHAPPRFGGHGAYILLLHEPKTQG